jgi:hypothetical protein
MKKERIYLIATQEDLNSHFGTSITGLRPLIVYNEGQGWRVDSEASDVTHLWPNITDEDIEEMNLGSLI